MRRSTFLCVSVATIAVLGLLVIGSNRPAAVADAAPTTRPATAPSTVARDAIATGDLLIVYYPDVMGPGTDYARPGRVGPAGVISVPLAGDLRLAGMTLREAEQAIGARLNEARVVERAMISIDRQERGDEASVKPGPIAPGDVLRIAVWELLGPGVEQVRRLHVSEEGCVGLPLLGQTRLGGMTEAEAEAAVTKAYRDAQMVERAVVSVLRVKPPPGPEPIPPSTIPRLRPK